MRTIAMAAATARLGRDIVVHRTELGENTRPATRSLGEACEVVLLVGRVDAVIVKGKTDEEHVHAEPRAKRFDDGDRGAAADHHRRLAPFGPKRTRGGLERGCARIEADGGRAAFAGEGGARIGRQTLLYEAMPMFDDLVRLLSGDEPKRELGGGMRRDHRLRAGSAIAAVDAVDFGCRPRPELLEDAVVRLAGGSAQADPAEKACAIEAKHTPSGNLGR